MRTFLKPVLLFAWACSLTCFSGCQSKKAAALPDKNIEILFTGDTHCKLDGVLNFASVSALKKDLLKETPYVTLIDAGDAVQGELIGTISKGLHITQLMNACNYDYAIIGNHEFDFGLKNFSRIISFSKAKYLNTNVKYTGHSENNLEGTFAYDIKSYGNVKVAFLGVSTPLSVKSSTPAFFMENGKFVYDFCEGNKGSKLFSKIQNTTKKARKEGADYVVVVSHLGMRDTNAFERLFNAASLINHTSGIDAVIDAHEHELNEQHFIRNLNGKEVLLTSCGTKFDNIGKLTINTEGKITSELVHNYTKKDPAVLEEMELIKKSIQTELASKVAYSNMMLSINDENGIRLVRTRETAIGNLCADAYRAVTNADIGLANGGGIRKSLPKGHITNADIINIHPFNNTICSRKIKGSQLLDCLEFAAKNVKATTSAGGKANGEFGGFLSVSGLRFTIDTSISTPILTDEKGMLTDIHGYRRIKNVEIEKNGLYVPLDPKATYLVASNSYIIKNSGDGNTTLTSGELIHDDVMIDNQALIYYITEVLKGDVSSRYSKTEGRITVK